MCNAKQICTLNVSQMPSKFAFYEPFRFMCATTPLNAFSSFCRLLEGSWLEVLSCFLQINCLHCIDRVSRPRVAGDPIPVAILVMLEPLSTMAYKAVCLLTTFSSIKRLFFSNLGTISCFDFICKVLLYRVATCDTATRIYFFIKP